MLKRQSGRAVRTSLVHYRSLSSHRSILYEIVPCPIRTHLRLDSTGANHLLPQVVLVLTNGAIPPSHSLVLAHHDVLGNLVEQSVCKVSIQTEKRGNSRAYLKS